MSYNKRLPVGGNSPTFGWLPILLCFAVGIAVFVATISLPWAVAATFFGLLLCLLADALIIAIMEGHR